MAYTVHTQISNQIIADTITGAVECNPMAVAWCRDFILVGKAPCMIPRGKGPWYAYAPFWATDFKIGVRFDDPEKDDEGDGTGYREITRGDVQRGLKIMSDKYPRHFADMVREDGDAVTADVLLQCVVLGEVIYG